jgi:hypothetical protein
MINSGARYAGVPQTVYARVCVVDDPSSLVSVYGSFLAGRTERKGDNKNQTSEAQAAKKEATPN